MDTPPSNNSHYIETKQLGQLTNQFTVSMRFFNARLFQCFHKVSLQATNTEQLKSLATLSTNATLLA